MLVAGVALLGCTLWIFADRLGAVGTVIGFPLMAVALAMLVAAAAETRCWFGRMRVLGAKMVATLAFSLYLTHKEVAHLDALWLPRVMDAHGWESVGVLVVSCLAVAAVLYFTVERPFLMMRDRREGRRAANVDVEVRVEPAL